MPSLQHCLLYVSTVLLWAGLSSGADLASAKRAYEKEDYTTALKELTPLAEQGDAEAQLILGKMYMKGQSVSRDSNQAMRWFKASATQGNADAQFFLGSMYVLPRKDVAEGVKWLRLSADQGNQDAQLLLGKTYLDGREVPRDPVQAEMWLSLAAKDNLPFYQTQLASAERKISPDQRTKGKALAASWKPKPELKPAEEPRSGEKPDH